MSDPVAAVMVHVPDWREGFTWYHKAFPAAQVRSLPDVYWQCLEVDGVMIEVVNADEKVSPGAAGTVVYWSTQDLDARLDYLVSIGATLFRGPMSIEGGQRICQVKDPFGNSIGIREVGGESHEG